MPGGDLKSAWRVLQSVTVKIGRQINVRVAGGHGRAIVLGLPLALCLFCVCLRARAQEPTFGFTYTTDTLPKEKFEITQWSTTRFDKAQGSFWLQENQTELEYGLTNRLQMAVYADYDSTEAYRNGPFEVTTPPEPFSNDVPPPNSHYSNTRYIGATVEAIYRLVSPYEHPLGVALYQEATVGPVFFEPESKLILQRDFREDLIVLVYNFTYAPELAAAAVAVIGSYFIASKSAGGRRRLAEIGEVHLSHAAYPENQG